MKKLIVTCFALACFGTQAQTENKVPEESPDEPTFCLVLKDGITVLMKNGKQVLNDVELENGLKIRINGEVTKKDGTQFTLKQDECIDTSGNLAKPVVINDPKKESNDKKRNK